MAKLTICITSYNYQDYLPESIQSALDQTIPCEVIVVDDGSTDKSLEVAKRFPVKVISQVNKGLPSARNTGIMNATGDYILFLDADDMIKEDYAENILKIAEKTNSDVIYADMKAFGKDNYTVVFKDNLTVEDFVKANYISYCSAFKLSVLKLVGGYSPKMKWGYEDYALNILLCRLGFKFVHLPEVMLLYRTKENSMITNATKHHFELMCQIRDDNPTLNWNG